MAKKPKKSETLRQREFANKEFIELKKMQRGEIEPEKKPETPPEEMTLKKKAENLWFYYGKFLILGIIILAVIVFSVNQCMTKTKYDIKIIYFTYEPVSDNVTSALAEKLKEYTDDTNKDGEINVMVVNCSCDKNSDYNIQLQKMQALIAADDEAMLFIVDEDSLEYFKKIRSDNKSFFSDKTAVLPDEFFKETYYTPEKVLTLYARDISQTNIENDKSNKFLKTAENIIKNLNKKK